jgi:Spy/CpxP family protein refolding chaperone
MQKPNRLPWILVALLVGLNLVVLTVVWMRPPGPPHRPYGPGHGGPPPPHGGLAHELRMTEEGSLRVQVLQEAHFRKLEGLRDQLIALRLEAFTGFGTPSEDSTAARTALAKIGEIQVAIESERYQHFHDVLQLCTPAEAKRFQEILPQILSRKSQPENRPDGPPPMGGPHGGPPPR